MQDKKDLDNEELMNIAENSDEVFIPEENCDAFKFAYALNLKPGDTLVQNFIIYEKYKEWKGPHANHQHPISFFRDFKKRYKRVQRYGETSYKLDPAPFDLSQDNYWRCRKKLRQRKANEKKNKKK